MSGQHTQGRIGVVEARTEGFCLTVDGRLGSAVVVASEDEYGHYGPIENEADARRLTACWNSFDGVRTEMIEATIGTGSMQAACDAMSKLPAAQSGLAAARALLQELIDQTDEVNRANYLVNIPAPHPDTLQGRIRSFLEGK